MPRVASGFLCSYGPTTRTRFRRPHPSRAGRLRPRYPMQISPTVFGARVREARGWLDILDHELVPGHSEGRSGSY